MDSYFDLLIKNTNVLVKNKNQNWKLEKQDIAISKGIISEIGKLSDAKSKVVLDGKGLTTLPGLIDTQVHFREPGLEHKEDLATGTKGALLGGITGVFEMPNTNPSTITALDFTDKITRAKEKSWVNFAFYMGAANSNIEKLNDLELLPHCSGIKIFMGSSTGSLLVPDDESLSKILANGHRRISVHCEDEYRLKERFHFASSHPNQPEYHPIWRDEESSLKATQRIVNLAKKYQRPVHILHVTTKEEMDFLKNHKDICTVECLPQHLTLSAPECYEKLGTLAQMNPPIRDKSHQDALWKALELGVVDVLGSDHAPHTLEEKSKPYPQSPSGMTGVQTIIPLMLNHVNCGKLSLSKLVELMSFNPSRIWNLQGHGLIEKNYKANLTIVDLNCKSKIENSWIASKSGWTPYDQMTVTGWPKITIINGHISMRDNEIIGSPSGKGFDFKND